MKKINSYIIPFLLTFMMCLTTISHAFAVDTIDKEALDVILYTDGTYSIDGGNTTTDEIYFCSDVNAKPQYSTYLYFKGGKAITWRDFIENPDFSITFNLISCKDDRVYSRLSFGYANTHKSYFHTNLYRNGISGSTGSFTLNSQSKLDKTGTIQSYVLSEFFADTSNSDAELLLDSPILIYSTNEYDVWTLNTTGITTGGTIDTETDNETGTGGTTDGTEDDDSGILQGIKDFFTSAFDSLKSFFFDLFSELFSPITEWYERWKEREEASASFNDGFLSTLKNLIDKLKDATINPFVEMFDSLSLEAIAILNEIYEFPMIKELLIAVVGLAVFSGILMLLTTF